MLQRLNKWLFVIAFMVFSGCVSVHDTSSDSATTKPVAPAVVQERYQRALQAMQAGDDTAAVLQLNSFTADYPSYPGAWVNLAILHARAGNPELAQQSLDKALLADPAFAPAYNRRGLLLSDAGQFDAAADAYKKAIDADPEYQDAYYNIAVLYDLYRQQPETALAWYERYREVTDSDEQVKQADRWIAELQRRIGTQERAAQVGEES